MRSPPRRAPHIILVPSETNPFFYLSDRSIHKLDRALTMTAFVWFSALQCFARFAQMMERIVHMRLTRKC